MNGSWFFKIPAHWTTKRLRLVFKIINGSTPRSEESGYWEGDIPWATPDDLGKLSKKILKETARHITHEGYENSGTTIVPPGSLVLSTRAPIGYVAVAGMELCTNQGCRSLVFRGNDFSDYMYYQMVATRPILESLGDGSTFRELAPEKLRELELVVPLKAEQQAIARFLDRETAKIDALIAKKERLIQLLQEKRTALITHAVRKGLDPKVPMKDSGVEWLGEIPAHWEVKRLWHLTPSDRRIMYGIVLPGPNVTEGVPIVKGGDVSAERLRLELLNRTTSKIESAYARSRLRSGDLVFAIRGSIGEVAIVPNELQGANLTQDAARVSYTTATHGQWLFYALKSTAVFAQLERGALGATIRGINIRDLKRASIPVPQRLEQEKIAAFLEREMSKVNVLVAKVREGIDRLKEYRTALISAAVTGKIDVREAV